MPFFLLKSIKVMVKMELALTVSKIVLFPLSTPLLNIFNLSLEKRIFPDELKIAKVTPIYKTGDENGLGNYRPISALPCFFKILKRIMYKKLCNRIISYYIRNNLTFNRAIQKNRTFNCLLIKLILALKKKRFFHVRRLYWFFKGIRFCGPSHLSFYFRELCSKWKQITFALKLSRQS